jgi:hypothetical protein
MHVSRLPNPPTGTITFLFTDIEVGNAGSAGEAGAIGETSELSRGAVLLGAAAAVLRSMDAMLAAEDRRPYERAIERAHAQLGEEAFQRAWQEGLAMSMEDVIEYALGRTPGG